MTISKTGQRGCSTSSRTWPVWKMAGKSAIRHSASAARRSNRLSARAEHMSSARTAGGACACATCAGRVGGATIRSSPCCKSAASAICRGSSSSINARDFTKTVRQRSRSILKECRESGSPPQSRGCRKISKTGRSILRVFLPKASWKQRFRRFLLCPSLQE